MKVVYEKDSVMYILVPSPEALKHYPLSMIAQKDVPEGVPFWIIADEEIPTDRTFRDAWVYNPTRPADGIGSKHNTFEGLV